jgi:hypothetical protein
VRGKLGASEVDVPDRELEDHIVSWPLKWPKGAKEKARPGKQERKREQVKSK